MRLCRVCRQEIVHGFKCAGLEEEEWRVGNPDDISYSQPMLLDYVYDLEKAFGLSVPIRSAIESRSKELAEEEIRLDKLIERLVYDELERDYYEESLLIDSDYDEVSQLIESDDESEVKVSLKCLSNPSVSTYLLNESISFIAKSSKIPEDDLSRLVLYVDPIGYRPFEVNTPLMSEILGDGSMSCIDALAAAQKNREPPFAMSAILEYAQAVTSTVGKDDILSNQKSRRLSALKTYRNVCRPAREKLAEMLSKLVREDRWNFSDMLKDALEVLFLTFFAPEEDMFHDVFGQIKNKVNDKNICIRQLLQIVPMILADESSVKWSDALAKHVRETVSFVDICPIIPSNKHNPVPEFRRFAEALGISLQLLYSLGACFATETIIDSVLQTGDPLFVQPASSHAYKQLVAGSPKHNSFVTIGDNAPHPNCMAVPFYLKSWDKPDLINASDSLRSAYEGVFASFQSPFQITEHSEVLFMIGGIDGKSMSDEASEAHHKMRR